MPRPSLKAERTEEIIDAIERCVIRDGINGATLEKIAEEAGIKRSLLRHNVGNRDQLIDTFLDRFFARSDEDVQQMLHYLPESGRIPVLLDFLFKEQYSNSRLTQVALALTSAAASHDSIRQRLRQWNSNYVSIMADELQLNYQNASTSDCYDVAAGLTGIYFNSESLAPLGDMTEIREASRKAAERLLSTLEH